ncbi:MAG: hypothetical protein K2Q22_12850 [Cytophagales bacterium]|nr:hypothetical protein [Cytophagales bacterium]
MFPGTPTPTFFIKFDGAPVASDFVFRPGIFSMKGGATDGWVITSDAAGNGTWKKPNTGWDYSSVTPSSSDNFNRIGHVTIGALNPTIYDGLAPAGTNKLTVNGASVFDATSETNKTTPYSDFYYDYMGYMNKTTALNYRKFIFHGGRTSLIGNLMDNSVDGQRNLLQVYSGYIPSSGYRDYMSFSYEFLAGSTTNQYAVFNAYSYNDVNPGGLAKPLIIQNTNDNNHNVGIGDFSTGLPSSKLAVKGVTQIMGSNAPEETKLGLTMGNLDYGSPINNLPGYTWIQSKSDRPLVINPTGSLYSNASSGSKNYVAIGFDPSGLPSSNTKLIGYMLAVNGSVMCTLLRVQNLSQWPDYVFEEGYKLPELNKVEENLKREKHLEGIPSAQEVKENGVDVGEMNAKLLQKVEELYLYVIQQSKEIEGVKKQNAVLQSKLDALTNSK